MDKLKIIGAVLILFICGGTGIYMVVRFRREETGLVQLAAILEFMECELEYRLTPLPQLCLMVGREAEGELYRVFTDLYAELEAQISPDVFHCMRAALQKHPDIPKLTRQCLEELAKTLGRFDLQGQLRGLRAVQTSCQLRLQQQRAHKETKLRSYQTLGFCAGAAIVVLLI